MHGLPRATEEGAGDHPPGPRSVEPWLAAGAALLLALSFGLSYGIENHSTYLLWGLHAADPSFLQGDWLVGTADRNPLFSGLVWLLTKLGVLPWAFASFNLLAMTGTALALYGVARGIAPRDALPAYVVVLGLALLDRTGSVGHSYALGLVFQPSTLGGLGFMLALAAFARGRYLAAGIALAVGGLFHANYLLLGFPLFVLAHLLGGREQLPRRLASTLGPLCLALLPHLPRILAAAGANEDATLDLWLKIRGPHHYAPLTFLGEYPVFAVWATAGVAAGVRLRAASAVGRRTLDLLIGLIVMIGGSTLLSTVVWVPSVAALFVWRVAPFAVLLSQLLSVLLLVQALRDAGDHSSAAERGSLAGLAGCWIVLALLGRLAASATLPLLLGVCAAALAVAPRAVARLRGGRDPVVLHAAVWLLLAYGAWQGLANRSTLLRAYHPLETELYRFARATPPGTVFLVPPALERFRLHGERAIVVDWKSQAMDGPGLLEWHRRIRAVSQDPPRLSEASAERGYALLSSEQLAALSREFSVDYVVVRARPARPNGPGPRVFQNAGFVVFGVP